MKQTTFTCDKCGDSWVPLQDDDHRRQIWSVGLVYDCAGPRSSRTPSPLAELCRPCMESFGIVPAAKPAPHVPDPKPTALELIEQLAELLRGND